jgi:hypothetical protein
MGQSSVALSTGPGRVCPLPVAGDPTAAQTRRVAARRLWQQALEQERRVRRNALSLLRVVERLNGASCLAQVVEAVRRGVRELLGARHAAVERFRLDEPSDTPRGANLGPAEPGVALTLEAWTLAAQRNIWLENAQGIQGLALPLLDDGTTPGAAVATLLYSAGRPDWVITAYFDSPRLFTGADQQLLTSFLQQASVALQRSACLGSAETDAWCGQS